MALPAARRPLEVEEENREIEDEQKKACLKKKVNLYNVFMDTMISWYHTKLKPVDRKKLKKKHIINKATKVAFDIKLSYWKLPPNWLRQLHDDHGVEFISFPPAEKAKIRARRRLKQAYIKHLISKAEMERLTEQVMSGTIPPEVDTVGPSTIYNSEPAESFSLRPKVDFSSNIIDLTDEPPPEKWVSAFMNGQLLPRVLKVHKFENDQIIAFYDYDAKIGTEDGRPYGTHLVHEAINFLSWKDPEKPSHRLGLD